MPYDPKPARVSPEAGCQPETSCHFDHNMIGLVSGIGDGGQNVFPFEIRVVGEDLLVRCSASQQFQNVGNANP